VGAVKTLNGSGAATLDAVTGATTLSDIAIGKYCWRVV
jgi:hypothetical protein